MKIQVFSDIHYECNRKPPIISEKAEIVIMAGDIVNSHTIDILEKIIKHNQQQFVFVTGNHEYYGGGIIDCIDKKYELLDRRYSNFHFLNNSTWTYNSIIFVGGTLWTNFGLATNKLNIYELVNMYINDSFNIKVGPNTLIKPTDMIRMNEKTKQCIKDNTSLPCIVVTHFGPHPSCIHDKYKYNILTPYFVNDCSNLFNDNIKLWVHGHTHSCINLDIGNTKVVCNPYGYNNENPHFDNDLILTL